MKFAYDLDLQKVAQLVNALLHSANTATINAALSAEGQIGYDTTLDAVKYFDGSAIQTLARLSDILNDSTLGGGSASTTRAASQASIKAYVDAATAGIATGLKPYPTLFDAGAASTFPSGYAAGDWYRVTVAGTVLGVVLEVGDTVYPTVASPSASNAAHWYVAQSNVSEASNSVFGFIKTATLTEFEGDNSAAANKAMTVSVLNAFLSSNPIPKSYVTTVNLINGTVGVTHNLGGQNLHVTMSDASGPVHALTVPTSNNAINITAKTAISSVKVVITKV
jgi:hypothetical protein